MLVLSRKCSESVVVESRDPIERLFEVTVLEIRDGSVMPGFEADEATPVQRLEVWNRIRADAHAWADPTHPEGLLH
jgi:carbon storage regulator CsrA